MDNKIENALARLFEKHRIVFWYDEKSELRKDFESVELPGVQNLEVANNEFSLKYHILREEPKGKFLLYREGPQPADIDNWLLDVQLAHAAFNADQAAIWLSELGLDPEFSGVVDDHVQFYKSVKRKDALKDLLEPEDTHGAIRLKMLAVCAGSEPRMDTIAENLLDELSKESVKANEDELGLEYDSNEIGDKCRLIRRCNLDGFFWERMERFYGYESEEPSIRDFVIQLFKDCYFQHFESPGSSDNASAPERKLSNDAVVFLKRWKDSRQFEESFECLSAECAEVLGIEQDLLKRDFRELIDMDYFCVIDQKIISDLVKSVAGRTVSRGDVALWVRERRQSHWYGTFRYLYEGIDYAARFLDELTMVDNQGELKGDNASEWSLATWIERYSKSWFNLDQLYRKFCYSVRMSGKASLMGELTDQVENLYSTNYLLRLNDRFQSAVDSIDEWDIPGVLMQHRFYQDMVKSIEGKVCVIVSDALRYEIGEELSGNIRSANKYKVELEHMAASLPSYTQLGMASLLPHSRLEFSSDNAGQVLADGQSTNGLKAREKLLQSDCPESTALKAEEVFALRKDDLRALCRDNQIVYVFHNSIDAVGDDLKTEDKVFEAAQSAIGEIKRIITKLGGENYILNFLVTSDHGFVYQNTRIDESDFSGTDAQGNSILCRNRRFVIGKGLKESSSLKKFTGAQLGVAGDWEVQIPKSINRLRLKGSGSRFVHGGVSLQELVLPLLRISKKRPSDIAKVDVNILRGNTNIITSGQLAVGFYQEQAMTDKVQPRVLRAGIYTEDGELVSDSHDITFDLESENPRDRELPVRFVLTSKADEMNDQEVILKLEERHAGTSHYKEYRSLRYQLRRSFTSDFEF